MNQTMKRSTQWGQFIVLLLLASVIIGVIFIIDLNVPASIPIGALYCIVILYSWLLPGNLSSTYIAIVCTILIIVGYSYSPNHTDVGEYGGVSAVISVIVIWICSALVSIAKRSFDGLQKSKENLEIQVQERTKELQDSQQKLKESEQLYRYLYEHAHEFHVSVNPIDASIVKCNETLAKRLNYTKDELIGQSVFTIYHPECHDEARKAFFEFKRIGKIRNIELKALKKTGEVIDVLLNASAVRNERDEVLYSRSSLVDITERKRYAQKLEAQNKELEQFTYVTSHDLKEPLNTVSSFVDQIILEYKGQIQGNCDTYLKFIYDAVDRMKMLIDDLLDYSRLGKSREKTDVHVAHLVDEILKDLSSVVSKSKSRVLYTNLPTIRAYRTELRLLFQNLISNAIKFQNSGTQPKVTISAEKKSEGWIFSITDNGIGISETHLEQIFTIFRRLHSDAEYKGTGIGLAHCKKIVDIHEGRIWVESKLGVGSTFFFSIPEDSNE